MLLHIPMLYIIFWATTHPVDKTSARGRATIAGLLVIHAGLHFALSGHELYEFQGVVALITIYGAALAGGAYLVLRNVLN